MDVIVGFPTETHDDFEDTYMTLVDLPWTRIHVFPYSERPGTYATRMPNVVTANEKSQRAQRLRLLSQVRQIESAARQIGAVKHALILRKPSKGASGLSRDYWPVQIENLSEDERVAHAGHELQIRVTGTRSFGPTQEALLLGEVVRAGAL
jgi:threonylcarbamoyladenosine tRNA methylthiotransferase MtaB